MNELEIIELEDGRKTFVDSREEDIYRASFARIERVHPDSNYYQMWIEDDSEEFYLYNTVKGLYVLTVRDTDALINSREFTKIEFYSPESESFVAYRKYDDRKDSGVAYLFYEDGSVYERAEAFIGEEHYGKRPFQNLNGDWVFFDCMKRRIVPHFKFKGHKNQLVRWLCDNYFVTKFENHLSLMQYRENESFKCIDGRFSEIEEGPNDYIIATGAFDIHRPYALIKDAKIIGHFSSKPIYDKEHSLFKAQTNGQWYFVWKDYKVTHYSWTKDSFRFFGKYILNNSSERGWLIFDSETGENLCQDWRNIRIDNSTESLSLLVDTYDSTDCRIYVEDIAKHLESQREYYASLLESSGVADKTFGIQQEKLVPQELKSEDSDHQQERIKDKEEVAEDKSQGIDYYESKEGEDYSSNYDFDCENIIPSHIRHIVFRAKKGRYSSIRSELAVKNVSLDDYVCWVFIEDNGIAITKRSTRSRQIHNCVFRKVYDKAHFVNLENEIPRGGFKRIDLYNVDENSIIDEINKWLANPQKKEECARTSESEIEYAVVKAEENINIPSQPAIPGEMRYENILLSIGSKIPAYTLFGNRQYRIKNDALKILLDDRNLLSIDYASFLTRHYYIKGEGHEYRFDQIFNSINESIRNNKFPIYLFKKAEGDFCELIDQVTCCAYSIVEEYRKGDNFTDSRKVINFDLESLCYMNNRKIGKVLEKVYL